MGWRRRQNDSGAVGIAVPEMTAGGITVRRIGQTVSLTLNNVVFGGLSGTVTVPGVIPPGFRSPIWIPFTTAPVYGLARGARTHNAGALQVFGLEAGDVLQAQVVYFTTDPFPEVK